jgi:hypothetical protein
VNPLPPAQQHPVPSKKVPCCMLEGPTNQLASKLPSITGPARSLVPDIAEHVNGPYSLRIPEDNQWARAAPSPSLWEV